MAGCIKLVPSFNIYLPYSYNTYKCYCYNKIFFFWPIIFRLIYKLFAHTYIIYLKYLLFYKTKNIISFIMRTFVISRPHIWNAVLFCTVSFNQFKYKSTRQYTPGQLGRAQPFPHEIIPTCVPLHKSGPPLSPWNLFLLRKGYLGIK